MSHHFDTPTAKEDPRINVCDFFLRGRPGTTVMALTVNPNASVGAPDTFRDEGLYAFRFDTKSRSSRRHRLQGPVRRAHPRRCGEHRHVQTFAVRRTTGADALKGAAERTHHFRENGARGESGSGLPGVCRPRARSVRLRRRRFRCLQKSSVVRKPVFPEAFQYRQNFFGGKNVTAIVLEVPSSLIGRGVPSLIHCSHVRRLL